MRDESLKYTTFKTNWGYFGLAGSNGTLARTCLPVRDRQKAESCLLKGLPAAQYDRDYFRPLQEQVIAYFEGARIDFSPDIPILLEGFSCFARLVLAACRQIGFGEVLTYSGLARQIGRPPAARAVGNALSRNPLPLIIPCHRVIRSNGRLGGFSAPGGTTMKKRLLELERPNRG
jgi:methylated-DNA-[protein]-cysteine S-methyltransferase